MGAPKRLQRPIPTGHGVSDPQANRERLVAIRKQLGLTQREMAQELGVGTNSYMRYEIGVRSVRDNLLQAAERLLRRLETEKARAGQT
jgi:transcriptional regulator with XRE-family HTH domain